VPCNATEDDRPQIGFINVLGFQNSHRRYHATLIAPEHDADDASAREQRRPMKVLQGG
jgi:hypothetical protein